MEDEWLDGYWEDRLGGESYDDGVDPFYDYDDEPDPWEE